MTRTRVLTGIDLPVAPSCGSMILVDDTYAAMADRVHSTFLGMRPIENGWHSFDRLIALDTAKRSYGPDYGRYVDELTAEVRELVRQHEPHVIHAQHLGFGLAPALVRAADRVPVISIAHGTDVIAADESEQARQALTEVIAGSAAVVAPNATLADHIDKLTDHRYSDRLTIIPWGIPLGQALVRHRPQETVAGPLNLLHAGRLDTNKNTVTAIEALAVAGQRHRLTIIGSGPEEEALRERAQHLGVQDRVRFVPFMPRQELWRRFDEFDAFVFTTSGLEAFGLVAIEAQAHGLPVAYSNVAGLAETLGQAGTTYTAGDPVSLAAALDELARDAHWRGALVRAGLDNARRYDIAYTAGQLADLTDKVASAALA
ncbi:glycosyltransferase family 4 protein [Kitasatospora aureofaciens]|uniref:glycosyltransferase family 4 protein n=1 Tax=Kitasatospora aureofaciens TaxID=1894 RepID=UPI001C462797|nr:glycosyltransferase family 4 protein [Kitasatospora aureofaciens]MBV6702760.1 glycosyltransferase family 4 protein [Kitasatospora aureofaciens]